MIGRRSLLALGLWSALNVGAHAQTGERAEGFAAEGVWMYQPRDGERVELAVTPGTPLRLFFKGFLVVTEVQRSQEFDLLFAVNMVEVRANNRRRGQATLSVKGGDGRIFSVLIQVADGASRPASPEIVTIR
jgi:hypothetical protein